jgi:hypothetical protein
MQNILSKKEVLMHEHHRKRMKERFLREGIAYFEPHNVLELLLFYAIPQKDTNEIAHRLIERFGSLSAVFEAPFSELIQVEGIKEHSATLIKLIPELAGRYVSESYGTKGVLLPTLDDAAEYLKSKYIGVTKEIVYLLLLDKNISFWTVFAFTRVVSTPRIYQCASWWRRQFPQTHLMRCFRTITQAVFPSLPPTTFLQRAKQSVHSRS